MSIEFKRGDTFYRPLIFWQDKSTNTRLSLVNYTIRSQIRKGSTLVAELVVTKTDAANGEALLSFADTRNFPAGDLVCDIELTNTLTGQIISSKTFTIPVEKDITHE